MWRALRAADARVALVFNLPWLFGSGVSLHLMFSPVAYLAEADLHRVISEVIEDIRANAEFLRGIDREWLVGNVFLMFVVGGTCLKHEGFSEEREWRGIYSPGRWPSPLMECATEVVAGVPQVVCKVPLDENVSKDLATVEISRMLDWVIIGPSPYPWVMPQAFTEALREAGVKDAEKKYLRPICPSAPK
jgi:hypothetical protein